MAAGYPLELSGQKFNNLTVIRKHESKDKLGKEFIVEGSFKETVETLVVIQWLADYKRIVLGQNVCGILKERNPEKATKELIKINLSVYYPYKG